MDLRTDSETFGMPSNWEPVGANVGVPLSIVCAHGLIDKTTDKDDKMTLVSVLMVASGMLLAVPVSYHPMAPPFFLATVQTPLLKGSCAD
jgi:hypothetical protein